MGSKGFIHRDGRRIVDGNGNPLLLHGVNLGNWFVVEGYIWGLADDNPVKIGRNFEAFTEDLVGAERSARFWREYRDRWITESDIRRIAELGFDHVRLPLNHRFLVGEGGEILPEGFAYVDRLIGWCRNYNLPVLLDLHAAPGGQIGNHVDDANGYPELLLHPQRYLPATVGLWRQIARRYADEPLIAGYDLLNEPIPPAYYRYRRLLLDIYDQTIRAIRQVDDRHLIMVEGAEYSADPSVFTELADDNCALHFHRYWVAPDESSLARYLEASERLDCPLYLGEFGENDPVWIRAMARESERHGIGWCFWTWKKFDTISAVFNAHMPDSWIPLRDHANGKALRPDSELAARALDDILDAIPAESCVVNDRLVRSLLGEPGIRIPAWDFQEYRSANEPMPEHPDGFKTEFPAVLRDRGEVAPTQRWHGANAWVQGTGYGLEVHARRGDVFTYRVSHPSKVKVNPPTNSFDITIAEGSVTITAKEDALIQSIDID